MPSLPAAQLPSPSNAKGPVMLLVSITNPPQDAIGYDGVTYTGPVFDVPQNVGELLMGRADLWRLPTQDEIDGDDVDHAYDGRYENRGRPEHLHDGRTRRRGAEALAEVPEPDREREVKGEVIPLAPGSTEPTDLSGFSLNHPVEDDKPSDGEIPAPSTDEPKPAAKKTVAKKTAAPKPV
jgi:hypothetical protein